jgi:hypothetical protein
MDTAKYFQNGFVEIVEIWHTVIPSSRFLQFSNIIYSEDTRLT